MRGYRTWLTLPLALTPMLLCGCPQGYYEHSASYPNMKFYGDAYQYKKLYTGDEEAPGKIAPIYIRFKHDEDQKAYFLPDLTIDQAKKFCYFHGDPKNGVTRIADGFYDFDFREGKLCYCVLSFGILVGSSAQGPFYEFHVTREQLVELFGEPESKDKRYVHIGWN